MTDLVTLDQVQPEVQRKFMTGVYLRMMMALFVSATVAWYAAQSEQILSFFVSRRGIPFWGVVIFEFLLVIIISATIRKLPPVLATFLFYLYAVVNGFVMCIVFSLFKVESIYRMFLVSALMFAGMSIYGAKTKRDLTSIGRHLSMALIGLIIAGLVNLLLHSTIFDWIASIVGIALFIGITAYDTQRILRLGLRADESDKFQKMAVIGALILYVDFINIFLRMLSLFGKKRD